MGYKLYKFISVMLIVTFLGQDALWTRPDLLPLADARGKFTEGEFGNLRAKAYGERRNVRVIRLTKEFAAAHADTLVSIPWRVNPNPLNLEKDQIPRYPLFNPLRRCGR